VFSATVLIALLGNVFQQWTFLCLQAHFLAGWRPSHTNLTQVKFKVILQQTVSRPVYLGVKPHLGPQSRFSLLSDSCWFVHVGAPFLTRGRVCHLQLLLVKVKVKVKVTLRLAVYRQSVHLGVKPLETHKQRIYFIFSTELLR
jgi:hypothetical protein